MRFPLRPREPEGCAAASWALLHGEVSSWHSYSSCPARLESEYAARHIFNDHLPKRAKSKSISLPVNIAVDPAAVRKHLRCLLQAWPSEQLWPDAMVLGAMSLSRQVFECRTFAIVYTRWKQCPRTRSDGAQRDGGTGPNNALRAGAPLHAALHVPQGRRQYSMLSHMLHSAALQPPRSAPLSCTRRHVCDNSRPRLVKQPSTHAAVPAPPAVDPACTQPSTSSRPTAPTQSLNQYQCRPIVRLERPRAFSSPLPAGSSPGLSALVPPVFNGPRQRPAFPDCHLPPWPRQAPSVRTFPVHRVRQPAPPHPSARTPPAGPLRPAPPATRWHRRGRFCQAYPAGQ